MAHFVLYVATDNPLAEEDQKAIADALLEYVYVTYDSTVKVQLVSPERKADSLDGRLERFPKKEG